MTDRTDRRIESVTVVQKMDDDWAIVRHTWTNMLGYLRVGDTYQNLEIGTNLLAFRGDIEYMPGPMADGS